MVRLILSPIRRRRGLIEDGPPSRFGKPVVQFLLGACACGVLSFCGGSRQARSTNSASEVVLDRTSDDIDDTAEGSTAFESQSVRPSDGDCAPCPGGIRTIDNFCMPECRSSEDCVRWLTDGFPAGFCWIEIRGPRCDRGVCVPK